LGATEVLAGFAGFVRERAVRRIEAQTALLALFTFIAICATWIDAWDALRDVTLDFAGLWAPILIATCYYLAATVVFPRDAQGLADLATYYSQRKGFVLAMLLVSDVLVTVTYVPVLMEQLHARPAVVWLYYLPYSALTKITMGVLYFVDGRRANIAILVALIIQFLVPYWDHGRIIGMIENAYGYSHSVH
ncbi:MAG TPA: hypothetical protein VFE05_21650, partial [Longimicrobiaceae bacterium]|nr:hypothetical protein [Longimicrobiaceae bacterium]